MKTYFISGLGANKTVFEYLKINKDFEPVFIDWKIPEKNEDILHYAERMASEINTNEPFILVGYSFGGMMVQEINRFLSPEKTILISTVKDRDEFSPLIKTVSKLNLHWVMPMSFFTSDKVLSYAFFRSLYDRKLPVLKKYFTEKDSYYLRWSLDRASKWHPKHKPIKKLYHIHGDKDMIFPIKYIKNPILVEGGSHLMVIQKYEKLSNILNECLLD